MRSASFELDRIQESSKLSRVFELTVHLPEAVVRPQNGSKIMQSIVELNIEETKVVVGGVRAKVGGGPLQKLERFISEVIRELDPNLGRIKAQ